MPSSPEVWLKACQITEREAVRRFGWDDVASVSSVSLPYQIVVGHKNLFPICEVLVLGPKGRRTVRTLIDSGALYSVFPKKAAEDAGLRLPQIPNHPVQYGGSQSLGWRIKVAIELKGKRWSPEIIFVEHLAFPYALLGRLGVFAHFSEVAFLERLPSPRVEFRA